MAARSSFIGRCRIWANSERSSTPWSIAPLRLNSAAARVVFAVGCSNLVFEFQEWMSRRQCWLCSLLESKGSKDP